MSSKRKKQPKRGLSSTEKLRAQMQRHGIETRVMEPLPGQQKLSAALIDFISPFTPFANTLHEFKTLVGMGVVAWNLPLLEGPARDSLFKEVIQPVLTSGDKEMRLQGEELFRTLIERKERLFADDKRLILNYVVTENREGFHVAVATTLNEPANKT